MIAVFESFSLPAAILAVAGIGALYALHHLRIQPTVRAAATLLFWRQSVGEQRTRVLTSRRFTHRRTFLLLAATIALLACAVTGDRWGRLGKDHRRAALVIDDGAATAMTDATGRSVLAAMTDAARTDLTRLPAEPALIIAGPRPTLLVPPGEPSGVVARRLKNLAPQDGASASSLALQMADSVLGDHLGPIVWYTSQTALPAGLPDEIARRVVRRTFETSPSAVAITGVVFESSPDIDVRGTLRVRLAGPVAPETALEMVRSGERQVSKAVTATTGGGIVTLDDCVADGSIVTLRLRGASANQEVRYHLPDRRPLTFRYAGDVPPAVRFGLSAAGSESANGDIVVVPSGAVIPTNARAAIVVVNDGAAVTVGAPLAFATGADDLSRGLELERATAADGPAIDQHGGETLLTAGGATVASIDRSSPIPTLWLSTAIVGDHADFPRHAVFPIWLARTCEALAGHSTSDTFAVTELRRADDPLWAGPSDVPAANIGTVADALAESSKATPDYLLDAPSLFRWADLALVGALVLFLVDSLLHAAKRTI